MATRSQAQTQITWSASDTNEVAADGVIDYSDDFTFSSNLIKAEVTVSGESSGTASDDILNVYCSIKRDPNNSNSGTPDTYDAPDYSYVGSIDCSSGSEIQRTFILEIQAGNIVRFGAMTDGTNSITVGFRVSEDRLAL